MTFLLDINIVIYQLNGLPAANELVDAFFEAGIAISVITYVEAMEGISRST